MQQPGGQQLSVSDYHDDVGTARLEERVVFRASDLFRLPHRNAVCGRKCLDGRRLKLLPAPSWTVRLRKNADNFKRAFEQHSQRRDGELRRAEEDDTHRSP